MAIAFLGRSLTTRDNLPRARVANNTNPYKQGILTIDSVLGFDLPLNMKYVVMSVF